MEKDRKRFLRAVLVIFITAFCIMKLPHSSKSIFQFIMPPIKTSPSSRLYLNGFLTIFLMLWSYREIVRSNYFNRGRVTIFLLMFIFIVPMITRGINVVKIPYYTFNNGLKTIEVIDSDFSFEFNGEISNKIKIKLHLKNYGNEIKRFNISLDLPESLSTFIPDGSVMLPDKYMIGPHKDEIYINEVIDFSFVKGYSNQDIFHINYNFDDYKINLFNEDYGLGIVLNDSP